MDLKDNVLRRITRRSFVKQTAAYGTAALAGSGFLIDYANSKEQAGAKTGTSGDKVVLRGGRGIGGVAEGEALVTREPVNLMADFGAIWDDPKASTFTNKVTLPELYGKSMKDKVFVFASSKGGIFSTQIMMELQRHGNGPKAMVNIFAHPVFVDAAFLMGIPLVDRLDQDPTEVIRTGDWVKVDAVHGTVEVTKKKLQ
jgi:predicted aconitase with swiveling domain